VAEGIFGARVGGVGSQPLAVVGQGAVNLAALRMDGNPLGAIHLRRANEVSGLAGADQDICLVDETIGLGQAVLPVLQGQPLAATIGSETGHVQPSGFEQAGAAGRVPGVVAVARHILVDVFEGLIVAHVYHHPAIAGQRDHRTFVLETAERGVLDRYRSGIPGVDLDHPAKAVDLVRLARDVEAAVMLVPAVAGSLLADAVTLLQPPSASTAP
jgi:hypothetical protein